MFANRFPIRPIIKMIHSDGTRSLAIDFHLTSVQSQRRSDTEHARKAKRGMTPAGSAYCYRSRRLSLTDLSRGLRRYSIKRRFPVLISTVAAIPGERFTCLPSTSMVERSMLTLVG